ncbi:segregation/condensation protein A [Calidifontibacillus oryziterrae]|uniref:segregation/condensation protein A n=1 Tax=Calidifontibacillus oryziterrae TaxID=1191699 RepID=UPI0002EE37E7|nr:segregation/condensation protein A [Calidifontibacillus oryziterrae]
MEYSVKLDAFEGPLDLLLHLINRYEIDIYDIPMAQLTEQYLRYIHTMQELKLDVASEYLVMAATLLAIKSKMLLPKNEESIDLDLGIEGDEFIEDPREELMRRLLEYRKFKEAASQLKEYELDRSQLYTRPPGNLAAFIDDRNEKPVLDVSIYDMLSAFQQLLKRKRLREPKFTKVQRQEIPIQQRMEEILSDLEKNGGKRSFYSLFPIYERGHVVVTFLAILELMKNRAVHCEQKNNFEDIYIYSMKGRVAYGP